MSAPRPVPVVLRRRLLVGVVAVLVVVVAAWWAFVQELPGTDHFTVDAIVGDSGQLRPGSPVRIAGVDVGKVTGVGRGPGTSARIVLRIDPNGRPLRTDATLTVRPRLFLEGSSYVDLRPGTPGAAALRSGGTIPLRATANAVGFSPVLSTLTSTVREDLATIARQSAIGVADGGARGLRRGLREAGPAFEQTETGLKAAMGTQPDDVARLIVGADRVAGALAADAPALGRAVTATRQVTGALAAEDQALTSVVRGVNRTLRDSGPTLRRLTPALPELTRFADRLDPSLRRAPTPLRRLAGLLDETRATTSPGELPALTRSARASSRALVPLAPRLRTLLPRVQRVSACVQRQGLGLLNTRLQDGAHTTGQTIWQELAHGGVNLASLAQTVDANGHSLRFTTNLQPNALALGSVPGVGLLLQNALSTNYAARPQWEGPTPPPFRPDVPCATQPLGDLQAASVQLRRAQRRTPTRITSLPDAADLRALRGAASPARPGGPR